MIWPNLSMRSPGAKAINATLWPAGMSEVVVSRSSAVFAAIGWRAMATLSVGWSWTSWMGMLTRLG